MTPEGGVRDVVLLHGLGRTASSFLAMRLAMQRAGYTVHAQTYPSRRHDVATLARLAVPRALRCAEGRRAHVVSHSMGAILLRHHLAEHGQDERIARCVMLGPPNRGSEVIDAFGDIALFRAIIGPAGLQLGCDDASVPRRLGPVRAEVGVIAGGRATSPILARIIGRASDGKVAVDATPVEGMRDFIVLPVGHTFMMASPLVIAQTLSFLRGGAFERDLTRRTALQRLAGMAADAR